MTVVGTCGTSDGVRSDAQAAYGDPVVRYQAMPVVDPTGRMNKELHHGRPVRTV